jgi:hypothetical protein
MAHIQQTNPPNRRVTRVRAITRLWGALEAKLPTLSSETIERLAEQVESLQPEGQERAA